ncbi:MAG TPA: hypothetical protein PKY82_06645 [Pyrinomonadaceae bacterium]|nr:hypothetical protein [Pyrinomonadaceae bacterium]
MNKFTNPLENIKIASPCSQDWDSMVGDTRKRFCGECNLNVYNLSGMTKAEAENLLINAEGRLCVRFYKRSDGTILTEDCPVGWAAFKRRISKTAAAVASLVFGVIGGLGVSALFNKSENERGRHIMGDIAYKTTPTPTPTPKATPNPREFTMGAVAIPTRKETPTPKTTPKKKDLKVTIEKVINAPENQS